jgi:hypothetical protein
MTVTKMMTLHHQILSKLYLEDEKAPRFLILILGIPYAKIMFKKSKKSFKSRFVPEEVGLHFHRL